MQRSGPYRDPAGPGEASPLACPRCRAGLRRRAVGATAVDACSACHGLWLAAAELDAFLIEVDRQDAVLELSDHGRAVERDVTYLRCPRCQRQMLRRNLDRVSGVVLDLCKAHGAWFDRGELRAAAAYLSQRAAGELGERSRRPMTTPAPRPGSLLPLVRRPRRGLVGGLVRVLELLFLPAGRRGD